MSLNMKTFVEERFFTKGEDEYADLLIEYNRNQPGHVDSRYFTCFLKDSGGSIFGKINFMIRADWLMVDYIGVLKIGDRDKLAKLMLKDVEQFAKTQKVENISVATISTKASIYIQKLGYEVVRAEDYTPFPIVNTVLTKKIT